VHEPVTDRAGVEKLRVCDPHDGLGYVLEAIKLIRKELAGKIPLIGFAGAPFTLASYLIEGGKSSHYLKTKKMMYGDPAAWKLLMEKLSEVVRLYLRAQVEAGAQAIQLFDSWIGQLSPQDYAEYVQPHVAHILKDVEKTGVPVIHFGTGTATLLALQKQAGGTVIGVDWRLPLEDAAKLAPGVCLQGNLDPTLLFAPRELLQKRAAAVVDQGKKLPGHVFNLGHGILPETPIDNVKALVDFVHEYSAR
jgi:uroporphyrinogen decarboxylase